MKDNFDINAFLSKNKTFDKKELYAQLKEQVTSLYKEMKLDVEEVKAVVEGALHDQPENIPLLKLWVEKIWKDIEK